MKKSRKIKLLAFLLSVVLLTAGLVTLFLPASATIVANGSWYSSAQSTLYINNASDLWAFAKALQSGKNFSGQTVFLTTDITVNENWDAFGTATPADKWPLTSVDKHFAGVFDGQGHTISGLYASASGTSGFGLFGDVARGTSATVRNLTILNSRIVNTAGAKTGTIFGEIEEEATTRIADDYYVNTTTATIDNVHLDVNVIAKGQYSGSTNGVGGFVGCNRTELTIMNSTFDGKVTSASRGVAAFVGATYPYQVAVDDDNNPATADKEVNCYKTYSQPWLGGHSVRE